MATVQKNIVVHEPQESVGAVDNGSRYFNVHVVGGKSPARDAVQAALQARPDVAMVKAVKSGDLAVYVNKDFDPYDVAADIRATGEAIYATATRNAPAAAVRARR